VFGQKEPARTLDDSVALLLWRRKKRAQIQVRVSFDLGGTEIG